MNEPANSLVLNVRGGARICVPEDTDQITTYVLLEQEDWFEDEIRFVRHWLRPGMRTVDVGASYGLYTTAMAAAVGDSGRVWAFEPTPQAADRLQHSLELNAFSRVQLSRCAISARAGMLAFASGARSELNAVGAADAAAGLVQVPAVTVDQMSAAHDWAGVDFVKLDVEGHEREVIEGGTGFFDVASPLVMLEIKAGKHYDLSAVDALEERGYEAYRLLPGPLMLVPFDRFEAPDGFLLNLFACKPARAKELADGGFLAATSAPQATSAPRDAWVAYAASAPYARGFVAGWRGRAGWFSGADQGAYYEGLAAFAQSRQKGLPPAQRLAWLQRALQYVAEAVEAKGTPARRLSYARIAAELGWRSAATECLRLASEDLASASAQQEPFLAPSQRYERIAAPERPADWLSCAVIEQYEKLRSYSSLYSGESSLKVLEPIGELPYRSAEVDRRLLLLRRRHGMPAQPESSALLSVASDENLNPQYWSTKL